MSTVIGYNLIERVSSKAEEEVLFAVTSSGVVYYRRAGRPLSSRFDDAKAYWYHARRLPENAEFVGLYNVSQLP